MWKIHFSRNIGVFFYWTCIKSCTGLKSTAYEHHDAKRKQIIIKCNLAKMPSSFFFKNKNQCVLRECSQVKFCDDSGGYCSVVWNNVVVFISMYGANCFSFWFVLCYFNKLYITFVVRLKENFFVAVILARCTRFVWEILSIFRTSSIYLRYRVSSVSFCRTQEIK